MLPRSRTRTGLVALLAAGLASIALADAASAAVTVSQTESADPVAEGGQVTYTMTVTNSGAAVEGIVLDVVATKPNDASPVDNPYLSLTASQGSCALGAGSFSGGRCSLGTLAAGAGATVTGVVEANFSMRNVAALAVCDATGEFCFPIDGGTSSEETTVTHPPSLTRLEEDLRQGAAGRLRELDLQGQGEGQGALGPQRHGLDLRPAGRVRRRARRVQAPEAGGEEEGAQAEGEGQGRQPARRLLRAHLPRPAQGQAEPEANRDVRRLLTRCNPFGRWRA